MAVKNRILLLKDYLQEHSDGKHPVKTPEIRKYLRENGCPVSVQTLRLDIQSLLDTGYDIKITEENGKPTTYSWINREWDVSEIQILADAVSACQFIPQGSSQRMIRKLTELAGPSASEELLPPIIVSERIKSPNEDVCFILQEIRKAIRNNRRIEFDYRHYAIEVNDGKVSKTTVTNSFPDTEP